jgi:hypothetical protein
MSRHQNAEENHNIETAVRYFETMTKLKYCWNQTNKLKLQ